MDERGLEREARMFRVMAEIDFRGASPLYERLARDAADDPEVLSLLLPAAPRDRLPHLLLAAVQHLLMRDGSDPVAAFGSEPFGTFRSWCLAHRDEIEGVVASHFVQTNEVGRSTALLPCLTAVATATRTSTSAAHRPLALVEVGASAGLNLIPDRYHHIYGETETGPVDSPVTLRPRLEGGRVPPIGVPEIVWRRGLDRAPVDITDDDAVAWLRACIWPEQQWRRDLLDAAVTVARHDPPAVVPGDAVASLAEVVLSAPDDALVCIVHTAVLPYLSGADRFVAKLHELGRERPLWWISGEPPGLVPGVPQPDQPAPSDNISFVYTAVPLGQPGEQPMTLARAGTHGAWLQWLGP